MRHDAQVNERHDTSLSFEEYVARFMDDDAGSQVREAGPDWGKGGTRIGGADYARLVGALRDARDAIAEARLDERESAYLAGRIEELTAYAKAIAAPSGERVWANRFDLTGRGSALPPEMEDIRIDPVHGRVTCAVTFGTSYVGAGDAAHGGAIALFFDELLGMCSNAGRPVARTAYLHVDYRAVTQLELPLQGAARIDRVEGRKRFVVGELRLGDDVVAEAEGLFIELRPWQQ